MHIVDHLKPEDFRHYEGRRARSRRPIVRQWAKDVASVAVLALAAMLLAIWAGPLHSVLDVAVKLLIVGAAATAVLVPLRKAIPAPTRRQVALATLSWPAYARCLAKARRTQY